MKWHFTRFESLEIIKGGKKTPMMFFLKGVHKQMAASSGVPFSSTLSVLHTGGWGCRSLFLSLSSEQSLAGQGLTCHNQIITAQTEVGVQDRDLGRVVSREGEGWSFDAWWLSFHRQMIYVEWDKMRGFWPSSSFHSGVPPTG